MLLSDLLAWDVVDADGRELGTVEDVLFVQDGPPMLPFGAALRLAGILVGHAGVGLRLGYGVGEVRRPALLKRLSRRAARSALYVPWEAVAGWESGVVTLSEPASAFAPPAG